MLHLFFFCKYGRHGFEFRTQNAPHSADDRYNIHAWNEPDLHARHTRVRFMRWLKLQPGLDARRCRFVSDVNIVLYHIREKHVGRRQESWWCLHLYERAYRLPPDLQSEIEAEHASTRIQQRETRGTFRTVNPRQRKQVRNNNPKSADNQRPTAHNTKYKTTQGPLWAPWHLRVVPPAYCAVAYTCNASLYTTSFPLTKATSSSRRPPVTKEEVVTSDPAVAEEAAAAARVRRSCIVGRPRHVCDHQAFFCHQIS
jgi:hypothetical protein